MKRPYNSIVRTQKPLEPQTLAGQDFDAVKLQLKELCSWWNNIKLNDAISYIRADSDLIRKAWGEMYGN